MKHNITTRLIFFFSSLLLLFALVVGMFFYFLFSIQTTKIHQMDLEKRAITISNTLSSYMQDPSTQNRGGKGGYGAYLKMIDEIAMSDIWIVDQNTQTISVGNGRMNVNYTELPDEAVELVADVWNGKVAFSNSLSNLLSAPSISVGAPIYDKDGIVIAAVLLHTDLSQLDSTMNSSIQVLLISLVVALLTGFIIAVLLSKKFTKPLKKMEQTTIQLIQGIYHAQTHVKQDDEIGSLAQNIDVLAQKLELAEKESVAFEQMRKDLISNISHELRTPVTVIRGSLEALCDGVITGEEKVMQYHQEMLLESVHLERMVNDLLELSRLQNLDYSIEKSSLNLVNVLSDSVRSVRHIANKKQVEISYTGSEKCCMVEGDYGRLRQMFITVLDNAVKFSKQGQTISVQAENDGPSVAISITDYGVGISPQDLLHIFERFYKTLDASNSKGTGLGLAIAEQIAQRHSISITASSEPNIQTTFVFKIGQC